MRGFALPFLFCLSLTGAMAAPEGTAPENSRQVAAQALADLCTKVACRKAVRTISLRTNDGKTVQLDTQKFPYLDEQGRLSIYPGEVVTLALPKNGDGPATLLKVSDQDGPVDLGTLPPSDSTVSFELRQRDDKPDMWLTITNTTGVAWKYDATMFVPTPSGIRSAHTSTCPLMAPQGTLKSFFGTEMWPHPIMMLVISNIHVQPKDAPMVCS